MGVKLDDPDARYKACRSRIGVETFGTEAANIRVAHVIGENEGDVGLGLAAREATAPDKCDEALAEPFLRYSLRLAMLGPVRS